MMEKDMYAATQSIRFEFSIPYRAYRYVETRITSFDRSDEIRAKNPQTSVCRSWSHSITLRQENVVKRRCEKVKIPRMRCSIYLGFDVHRATEHWAEDIIYIGGCVEGEKQEKKSIFSDYIHRDDWFVRTVRRDTWNEAPPKVFWLPEFMPGGCVTC